MRNSFLILLASPLMAAQALSTSPLISIGEDTNVYFDGFVSTAYSTNITLSGSNERDDLITTLSPGLEVIFGEQASIVNASAMIRNNIVRYADNDEFDSENWRLSGQVTYTDKPLTASASAFYTERQENQALFRDERTLLRTRDHGASIDSRYYFTQKTSASTGFRYSETRFDSSTNRDREHYTVPFNVYYQVRPAIDASMGVRYRRTEVSGGGRTENMFYNLGLSGEVTPKWTTTLNVGVSEHRPSSGNDRTTLGITSHSTYTATQKSIIRFRLNRDFEIAGQGDSVISTGGELIYVYIFNPFWNFQADGAYRRLDYQSRNREDDNYRVGASANYNFAEYFTLSGSYRYRENSSNAELADYQDHTVSVSLRLRY